MAKNSILQTLLQDPLIIGELQRRAKQSRWSFEDLVDETALQLLMKDSTQLSGLSNPTGYLLGVADHIVKSVDPVSLSRRRKVWRETSLSDQNESRAQHAQSDLGDFLEKVNSSIEPQMRPVIDAWLALPQGKSPVSSVAKALGVTQPTARKIVRRTKEVLKKKLKEYQ